MTIIYDKLPYRRGLVLDLPFDEQTGLVAHDRSKAHHVLTLHGTPTWGRLANGLPYLEFDRTHPDWLDCPAADTVDLDFTNGDFSIAIWVNPDIIAGDARRLICRGRTVADGWSFLLISDAELRLATDQAGASQLSGTRVNEVTVGNWWLLGASRSGASVRLYKNGTDVTFYPGTHINPATANRELHIGIQDNEINHPFDGKIAGGPCGPRIWNRRLSGWEHRLMFLLERRWLGV